MSELYELLPGVNQDGVITNLVEQWRDEKVNSKQEQVQPKSFWVILVC